MTLKAKAKSLAHKAKKTAFSLKRKFNEESVKAYRVQANSANKLYNPIVTRIKSKIRKMKKKK